MARTRISTGLFVRPAEPRTQKSARTRKLLLELASQLFVERGYGAVSIQEITDAAELTTGAFYGHFPSKGHLLVEVVRCKMAEADERMAAVVDIDSGADLLYAAERADLRLLEVDAAAAARHDPEVADGMRALYERRGSIIEQTVPVANDPEAAAWLVFVLNGGMGMADAVGIAAPPPERLHAMLTAALSTLFAAEDTST